MLLLPYRDGRSAIYRSRTPFAAEQASNCRALRALHSDLDKIAYNQIGCKIYLERVHVGLRPEFTLLIYKRERGQESALASQGQIFADSHRSKTLLTRGLIKSAINYWPLFDFNRGQSAVHPIRMMAMVIALVVFIRI